jgi:phenylacetate-CoA ligase
MTFVRQKLAKATYAATRPNMLRSWDELNDLQWLPKQELVTRQQQWVYHLLDYANSYVPYYQDLFKDIGFNPADYLANPACFRDIPFLTKDMVREHHDRLITTEPVTREHLAPAKTGGTTGQPLQFKRDQACQDHLLAHLYHVMEWSDWQLGRPQAWLWGHILSWADAQETSFLGQTKNRFLNRFKSNAFHLTPESMAKFATELSTRPGSLLWSYVSTMYRFAQFVEERAYPIRLQAAYTTAEPLYAYQRRLVEDVFDCRIFNTYSCVEMGQIASECQQHDGLHLMMRSCYLEVLKDGQPVEDGEEGEFILTSLTNLAFPFIRYRIEDMGVRRAGTCACGRHLPMLDVVEGRTIDFFRRRDGEKVWGAFVVPMVPALGQIKQYQIVQESIDRIVVRMIKAGPIDESHFVDIERACKIALGDNVYVAFEYVDVLPSTPTGKHRYVISQVDGPQDA